ncbi:hypothetical protein SAMN04488135_102276 [Pollutimonas bauzanensis]|uniref:Uncharacterized protein n=1 Tax=Pollutimonas bauzanensis TaxID=658167 RepID=A0A1M5QIK3_9BURK|nr:hypothetical protein SAMN04488135_102276 [Pollutimonas bauzanensis]
MSAIGYAGMELRGLLRGEASDAELESARRVRAEPAPFIWDVIE